MPIDEDFFRRVQDLMLYREAIASVSMSHDEECKCKVCRAANGDEEAFVSVVEEVDRERG